MIEREKTYLALSIPFDMATTKFVDMLDRYIPADDPHPSLRVRKQGERYE